MRHNNNRRLYKGGQGRSEADIERNGTLGMVLVLAALILAAAVAITKVVS